MSHVNIETGEYVRNREMISISDWRRRCRACLCLAGEGSVSAWRSRVARRLDWISGRQPQRGDGLPQRLCRECSLSLQAAVSFRNLCRQTLRHLHRLQPNARLNTRLDTPSTPSSPSRMQDALDDGCDAFAFPPAEKPEPDLAAVFEPRSDVRAKSPSPTGPCARLSRDESFDGDPSLSARPKRFRSNADDPFVCHRCGKKFSRKKDVAVHLRRHTGETPYSCSFCPKSFGQQATLTRHVRTHTGERPFPCDVCGKRFAGQSGLGTHRRVHSEEKKYTCDACGKAVKSKDALTKHLSLHENVKSHVCDKCGTAFAAKGNLNLHIKKVHSPHSGYCSACNRNVPDLREHSRKHTGETPYHCHVCGRSFSQKVSLSIHISKHESAGKFSCAVDSCRESFPMRSMMEFHVLKYHNNHAPYACTECERSFYRISDLSRHKKYHSNGKINCKEK